MPISNNPSPPSLALEGVTVAATPDILKRSTQAETVGHCLLGSDSISGETSQSPQIQLLESPIPAAPAAPAPSQKASSGDISGTKRGIIDPLVSKQSEKILNKKIKDR